MELYIYSPAMERLGLVDEITSLVWTRRYSRSGEFKLLLPWTGKHGELLKLGRLVMKRGGGEAGEIQYINVSKSADGAQTMEVQGKFLISWLGKRILTAPVQTQGAAHAILTALVADNCTGEGARAIPNFEAKKSGQTQPEILYAAEPFQSVQEAVEELAEGLELGVRVKTSQRTGKHTFCVYTGKDRTADNAQGNPPCVFCEEFDTVGTQEYTHSAENHKTTAYVGGEQSEDLAQIVEVIGGDKTGLARNEVYISASDIQRKTENAHGEQTVIGENAYRALLRARGSQEMKLYGKTVTMHSEAVQQANLTYLEDYDLGDKVTCLNRRWGLRVDVRITQIEESYEAAGASVAVTFGEGLPTLIRQIKKLRR